MKQADSPSKNSSPQLHLLDDGFQHRSSGARFRHRPDDRERLRRPPAALGTTARAAIVAANAPTPSCCPQRCSAPSVEMRLSGHSRRLQQKPIWRIERQLVLSEPAPPAPVVFCGIARPEQFFAQVRAAGIKPAAEVEFRDHHPYNQSDIDRLLAMRGKLGAGGFLTTEKDAVNLLSLSPPPISSPSPSPLSISPSTAPPN